MQPRPQLGRPPLQQVVAESPSGPLHVHCRTTILSPVDPQLRFAVKGELGSFYKYGLDTQEGTLKVGGNALSEGYGEEQEGAWGVLQVAKEEGKEALAPGEKCVVSDHHSSSGRPLTAARIKSVKGNYPAIYENLYDAIVDGDINRLAVTPEQAIMNIRVIEAGLRSSREKRTVQP